MRQSACGDVGVDAVLFAVLGVGLAPVARIQRHDDRKVTSAGGDPFQHWCQVFNIRRLAADAHSHDHLVVTVHRQLAVEALQVDAAGLHQMALGVSEIALGLVGWCAIGLTGQTSPGHGIDRQGSRSGSSIPAPSAAVIALSRAALAFAAATSAFLFSSACSAAGASACCAAVAWALAFSASCCL